MFNQYFGFSENPFNPSPDPRYLFLTESHQEALASVTYGVREKKGFVCISGEIGTGKTTLIRHLLNTLDSSIKTVFIYQTLISFEELLKEIVLELELPLGDQSRTYLTRQINGYLIQRLSRNETLVLFVDEAQNLNQEVLEGLRLLSNLETEQAKLLQIVLVGQLELEEKLKVPECRQFRQRIGIWRHLKPLTEEESREYIQHRLKKVGSTLEKVLTAEAVSLICQFGCGIPRTINILCDNAFLIGYALSKKKVDAKIVEEVLSDMKMLSEEKKAVPDTSDETTTEGQHPRSVAGGNPPALFGSNDSVMTRLTPREEGTPVDHGTCYPFTQVSPSPLVHYKRPLAILLVVFSFILAGFYVRGILARFAEGVTPDTSKVVLAQGNYQDRVDWMDQTDQADRADRPEPKARIMKTIIVKRGETISFLAQKFYGTRNYGVIDQILTVNPEIANPHHIQEGQAVRLPELTEDSWVVQADGTYKIWLETFPNAKDAGVMNKEASLKDWKIEILLRPVSSQESWYRAVIGDFETRQACLMTIHELKLKGFFQISRNNPPARPWT